MLQASAQYILFLLNGSQTGKSHVLSSANQHVYHPFVLVWAVASIVHSYVEEPESTCIIYIYIHNNGSYNLIYINPSWMITFTHSLSGTEDTVHHGKASDSEDAPPKLALLKI